MTHKSFGEIDPGGDRKQTDSWSLDPHGGSEGANPQFASTHTSARLCSGSWLWSFHPQCCWKHRTCSDQSTTWCGCKAFLLLRRLHSLFHLKQLQAIAYWWEGRRWVRSQPLLQHSDCKWSPGRLHQEALLVAANLFPPKALPNQNSQCKRSDNLFIYHSYQTGPLLLAWDVHFQ